MCGVALHGRGMASSETWLSVVFSGVNRPRYLRFLCAKKVTISGCCGTAATQTLALLLRSPWTLEGLNMYKTSLLELVFWSLEGCRELLFST